MKWYVAIALFCVGLWMACTNEAENKDVQDTAGSKAAPDNTRMSDTSLGRTGDSNLFNRTDSLRVDSMAP